MRNCQKAFTLVEMLVVVAVTVILMLALVQVFDFVGEGISDRRSIIEVSGELRAAVMRLQRDLDGVTVTTLPPAEPQAGEGYLEIIEGEWNDTFPVNGVVPPELSLLGDTDDLLMFTARSEGEPFVGRYGDNTIESKVAEIVWWIGNDPVNPGKRSLYRRVFLIRPDLNDSTGIISNAGISSFVSVNDISVRLAPSGGLVANSLADLTKRENRFGHDPIEFPHPALLPFVPDVNRYNEDLILFDPLAFDVRVYDPNAPMYQDPQNPGTILGPGDHGLYDPDIQGFVRRMNGAYVDLYYGNPSYLKLPPGAYFFADGGKENSKLTYADMRYATYDTWSLHYEYDGLNQDGDDDVDEGTDGLDNGVAGLGLDDLVNTGVDDFSERETSPPYPYPLRGLQVKVRVYEPDSQTVHQVTVTADFLPE